jgi:hypothetical protein
MLANQVTHLITEGEDHSLLPTFSRRAAAAMTRRTSVFAPRRSAPMAAFRYKYFPHGAQSAFRARERLAALSAADDCKPHSE